MRRLEIFIFKKTLQNKKSYAVTFKKKYWEQIKGSLDQVVMFIPEESIYSSNLQNDRKLYQDSLPQK